ncbi:MAG: hypothetical protein A2V66_14985 [Ignavibacteria bacterium RBG_13_36_8]|nr:MAG: hypothetical protein A2V66_14985 [Ignavibacteria bacterium RBG_13_36_8]
MNYTNLFPVFKSNSYHYLILDSFGEVIISSADQTENEYCCVSKSLFDRIISINGIKKISDLVSFKRNEGDIIKFFNNLEQTGLFNFNTHPSYKKIVLTEIDEIIFNKHIGPFSACTSVVHKKSDKTRSLTVCEHTITGLKPGV